MIFACICGIVLLGLLFVDLITKAWAYSALVQQKTFFLKIIRINYLPGGNTGIAFGFLGNTEIAMTVVTILTALMIAGLFVLYFTFFKRNRPAQICLAVIAAGAIGNFIDRVVLGYVRDFIDVTPLGFGICNLADFYITFGAVALLIVILFIGKEAVIPLGKYRKEKRAEEEKSDDATD